MAKKVSESKVTRFEYTVITDKFYLDVEEGLGTLSNGAEVPYYYCYLMRGKWGAKRFCHGCPQTDIPTGKFLSPEEVAESCEVFLIHSVMTYIEEEDAIRDYYESKELEEE